VSYSAESRSDLPAGELTQAGDVLEAVLCDLAAGVQYHIQVCAATSSGYGAPVTIDAWTEIGTPEKPPRPHVNSTGPGTITILIRPAVLTRGPVSAYFIVISTPDSNNNVTVERRRRTAADNHKSLVPSVCT